MYCISIECRKNHKRPYYNNHWIRTNELLKETNTSWDHKNQIAWTAGNASEKLANISKRVFLVPESFTDVIQQGFSIC